MCSKIIIKQYTIGVVRGVGNLKKTALISFRESLGKSRKEIADLLEVSESFYEKVEYGQRNPSYNFINKFKEKFPNENIDGLFFNKQSHVACSKKLCSTGTEGH